MCRDTCATLTLKRRTIGPLPEDAQLPARKSLFDLCLPVHCLRPQKRGARVYTPQGHPFRLLDTCMTLTLTSTVHDHLPPRPEGRCICLEERRLVFFFFLVFFFQEEGSLPPRGLRSQRRSRRRIRTTASQIKVTWLLRPNRYAARSGEFQN